MSWRFSGVSSTTSMVCLVEKSSASVMVVVLFSSSSLDRGSLLEPPRGGLDLLQRAFEIEIVERPLDRRELRAAQYRAQHLRVVAEAVERGPVVVGDERGEARQRLPRLPGILHRRGGLPRGR